MSNYVIVNKAVTKPGAYPWADTNCSKDEIDKVLMENNLDTEEKRKIAGWILRLKVLIESKDVESFDEVKDNVMKRLSSEKYMNNELVLIAGKMFFFMEQRNLKLYKKLINKDIYANDISDDLKKYLNWIVELATYYYGIQDGYDAISIQKKIEELICDKLGLKANIQSQIQSVQDRKGFRKQSVYAVFRENMVPYKTEINEVFGPIFGFEEKANGGDDKKDEVSEDEKLVDDLFDLFDSMPDIHEEAKDIKVVLKQKRVDKVKPKVEVKTFEVKVEEVENIENVEIESKSDEVENPNRIYEKLEDLSSELGYKLAKDDEVVISKEKYEKLLQGEVDKEVKLIKELASFKNGSILGELYNAYNNIQNISKENIEAIIANLFSILNSSGVEVIEFENKVGDKVEVNTSNVLKQFIFTEPVDKDGQVAGEVKYLGWSYKGKQIVPMVIKPIK